MAADNHMSDQQLIIELLDVDWAIPQLPLAEKLPPIEEGVASESLCLEIADFQASKNLGADGRVSVGGATWNALTERAQAVQQPPIPPPVLMSTGDFTITELPRIASGLPCVTYTFDGKPNVLYGPGYSVEVQVKGSLKVDWSGALPFAVAADAKTASLQTKVETGTVTASPSVTLSDESTTLQAESKVAIASLFASVRLGVDAAGSPTLGGSIGEPQGFTSVSWDPLAQAAVFEAQRIVSRQVKTSFGADVTVGGSLGIRMTVKAGAPDPASVIAALAVLVPALFVAGVPLVATLEGEGIAAGGEAIGDGLIKMVPTLLRWVGAH